MRKPLRVSEFIRCLQGVTAIVLISALRLSGAALDLVPAAHLRVAIAGKSQVFRSVSDVKSASALELEWDEERDIQEIRIGFKGPAQHASKVEYWFKNWPYSPPEMPSMEDPLDDRWQGEWLKAETKENCDRGSCEYTFAPLESQENPHAKNLPGTAYRRTLKVRVSYSAAQSAITSLQAFSNTAERLRHLSVQLGRAEARESELSGWFSAYNGDIRSVRSVGFDKSDRFRDADGHWTFRAGSAPKTFTLDVVTAEPGLPGSNDDTVVTVHTVGHQGRASSQKKELSFSFKVKDLDDGPIAVAAMGARVSDLDSAGTAPARSAGKTLRSRIPLEPEQTYERSKREIPALDPVHREWGGTLYLPLAADSSWQKFAFQLGGEVFLSKDGLRAKAAEQKRLGWNGDKLTWSIATGENAIRPPGEQVSIRPMDGYLPIVRQSWAADGLEWREEAFATLLQGPLSPYDKQRSERTPAVLLLEVTATNNGSSPRDATIWLRTDHEEPLNFSGARLYAGKTLRAAVSGGTGIISQLPGGGGAALKFSFKVEPRQSKSVVLMLPAVTDLSDRETDQMEALDYVAQRDAVENYWRTLIDKAAKISVPEPTFNEFVRATVAHIHLTAKKDPQTGLIMLGAASYVYDVYENESCYQVLLLDALGQEADAATLLKPMLELQGSENFPGAHTGSFAGVLHGVKISDELDYTANGYGLDHGTVLWTLAQHYLYTRDRNWFREAWPHIQKAIEWIETQRRATKLLTEDGTKVREYGLLPASKLEDNNDWANWFSINAFAYAGMDLTAQILTELNYPEAANIREQAASYREDLRRAVLRATEAAPVIRLQDGAYQPYVPTLPARRFRLFGPTQMNYYARYGNSELKPLLRLGADRDTLCGTVLLLMLGVFDVNDPIADWILNDWEDNETLSSGMGMNIHGMTDDARWFSQGGMVFQANLINPIPVYLKRHEIPAAIRNLYNDFVACFYPGANAFTEEFHQWVHASGPFYKSSDEARFVGRLRDMLVLEDKDDLWLASGAPRRWMESGEGINVKEAQTFFGPVTYTMRAGLNPRTIQAIVRLPERNPAKHNWLVVRTPSQQFRNVKVNGKSWDRIDRAREAIDLTGATTESVTVEVEY